MINIKEIKYICEDFFILNGFPEKINRKIPLKVIEVIRDMKNNVL